MEFFTHDGWEDGYSKYLGECRFVDRRLFFFFFLSHVV